MLTRKIAKIIRGKVTPLQLTFACLLGALIGFLPGLTQGPGLLLALLAVLVVLNANLWIATLAAALGKLLSLLLMPIQFEAGRLLLDGPTSAVFRSLINTPVVAWFGLDYYTVTGGLLLGLVVGLALSFVVVALVTGTRRKLAAMEQSSAIAEKLSRSKPAKFVLWVLVGGKGKESFERLSRRKVGNPIRPIGVALVALAGALGGVVWVFAQEPIVTAVMKNGLERANGATVDLDSADLDLGAGTLRVSGLAMADPEALSTDLLRAETLTADLGTRDLLTRRIAFDLIELAEASSGETRARPGRLVRPRPEPAEPPTDDAGEAKTIEDYIEQAELWRDRLAQAREWLEKVNTKGDGTSADPDAPQGETLRDRLRREVAAKGYTRVRAEHLIEGAPTVLVREVRIDGMTVADLPGEVFDVRGSMLSTQPSLVADGSPAMSVTSRSGAIAGDIRIGARPGEASRLSFVRKGLSGDRVGSMLAVDGLSDGEPPISGGTVDLAFASALDGILIDGTIDATLVGTTLALAGSRTRVDSLVLPIGVRGPIDGPRVSFSDEALADALVAAGKAELANRVRGEVDRAVGDALEKSGVGEEIKKRAGGLLGGVLGGSKDEDKDEDEEGSDGKDGGG